MREVSASSPTPGPTHGVGKLDWTGAKKALRLGRTPKIEPVKNNLANNAAAKVEAESQRAAAEAALVDLVEEERAAEKALAEAQAAVTLAVRSVLVDAAEELAGQVQAAEENALRLHARLAAARAPLGNSSISPAVAKLMAENGSIDTRNMPGWVIAEAARDVWFKFKHDLESDPVATLAFAS